MNFNIRSILPYFVAKPLWGDRNRWGKEPDLTDPCWLEWHERCIEFYNSNQKQGIGEIVNNSSYKINGNTDIADKVIAELGPGNLDHIDWLNTNEQKPQSYILVDINEQLLQRSAERLAEKDINCRTILKQSRDSSIDIESNSVDLIVTYYSLEHILDLHSMLREFKRILKPGGKIVGGIPTEGGLAWGLGRFLTTRRWLKKHTSIDPDKMICWEHPNFSEDVLSCLDKEFNRVRLNYWPLILPIADINLTISFEYQKEMLT